ncbi:TPA: restriction endonuclease subunit S [Elizabethkingia anophelis]|nr:restriction endonuclease subunit S [Elizabethkingia anophelis]
MKRYDKYKGSGVDWIGEIPTSWEIRKFKRLFTEKKKTTNASLNSGSISFGEVIYKDDEKITEATKLSYQVLNSGEFLLNPLNMNYDLKSLRIGLSSIDVVVSSGYIILQSKKGLDKNYYRWLLRIYDVLFMKTLGAGVRQTINYNDLADSHLVLPPFPEQQAIASFLDDKTSKIDQTISIKEKEIELLKERRQILIQKAVTKGLDDKVKLKDSGVEWIGEIPEHWEMKKLKYVVNMQSGETITAESFTDEGYPVMGGNGFRGFTNKYTNEGDFILIGRQGALCGNVNYAQGKFFATEHAIVVYPNKDVLNILWLGELIRLADLNKLSQTAAQPGISVSQIKNVTTPFIPIDEQQSIVIYLEKIEEKISKAISLKQQEIEKLKEYKTVLIDNVVTGKVKVY